MWRIVLIAVAVLASGGWIRGKAVPTFLGNPNMVTISITPGIALSRTSGETPAFVQASASATTGSATMANGGTLVPYEDFDYQWDCGNPNADYFINPNTGAYQPSNNQSGPEAACLYRSAGVYTITLNVRGCAAIPTVAGQRCTSFVSASTTATFTVTAFDKSGGEFYISQSTGNDANPGTQAQPFQTIAKLNSTMAAAGTNSAKMQFWLAAGDSWVASSNNGIVFSKSDVRVGKYGTGANPVIKNENNADCSGSTGASCNMISWDNTSAARSNTVVSNIDGWKSGTNPNSLVRGSFGVSFSVLDNYLDNVNLVLDNPAVLASNGGRAISYQWPQPGAANDVNRFGMWGGSIIKTARDNSQNDPVYGGAFAWNFFVGVSPWQADGDAVLAAQTHCSYSQFHNHGLFRWNKFQPGANIGTCIKVAVNPLGASREFGQWWLIAENDICCSQGAFGAGNSQGPSKNLGTVLNLVYQQNGLHNLSFVAYNQNTSSVTARYNRIWNVPSNYTNNGLGELQTDEIGVDTKFYGNLSYTTNTGSQTSGLSLFPQKVVTGTGTATWDDGGGGSGTVLNFATFAQALGPVRVDQLVMIPPTAAPGNAIITSLGTGTGGTGTYNLSQSYLYTPAATAQLTWGWTAPWTNSDNVQWETSANPVFIDWQFTNQVASKPSVVRNTWYAPNGNIVPAGSQTGAAFFNLRNGMKFSDYQAAGFGVGDAIAAPSWNVPITSYNDFGP